MRMLSIEARRNPGLFLFPFVAALVVYTAYETLPKGVWLWPHTSLSVRETLVLVGPLAAGLAAWAAGRSRRRGIEELLATTPRPVALRELATWGATAVWYGIAYTLAAASVLFAAYWGGAWGSPVLWPVLLGLLAIGTDSALGYAIGYYLPSYLTAPLVAVVLYAAQGLALARADSYASHLSPVVELDRSVFYGVLPDVFAGQSLWFLGVAGVALSFVALKGTVNRLIVWAALVGAAAVAVVGAAMLLGTPTLATPAQEREASVGYDPVCAQGRLQVCVHPAYAKLLPKVNAVANEIAEPLIGVPGGPKRMQHNSAPAPELGPDGTLSFALYDAVAVDRQLPMELVGALVHDPRSDRAGEEDAVLNDAQVVIAAWLLERSGRDPLNITYGNSRTTAALERFNALSPEEQTGWLRENYASLRAGEIALRDLP